MRTTYVERNEPRQERMNLFWLIVGLVVTGVLMVKVLGLPHLPTSWPTWEGFVTTLKGSELPMDGVVYFLTTLSWLLWGWLAFSLALELLVVGAEAVSRGAAWAAGLRAAADHLTAPFVRRVVDGAVVAAVVVNLVGRSASPAAAAPVDKTPIVLYHEALPDVAPPPAQPHESDEAASGVTYTVQAGDSLWAIAERFYGDGDAFPRLIAANVGRPQPGGQRFTAQGIIHPGWTLVIPDPVVDPAPERVQEVYVVVAGDTLWDIAARRLGDPLRWPEIFDLNRGVARQPQYGWTLTNPNLIWPGLPLRLPVKAASAPVEAPAKPTAEKPEAPLPVTGPLPEMSVPHAPTPKPVVTETAAPTPQATATLAPTPIPVVTPAPVARDEGLPPIVWGAVGLMTAAAVGAAGVAARRRVRRSLAEPPAPDPDEMMPPRGDFVDAEFARLLQHRLHNGEVEAVVLVADHTLRFLAAEGVRDVSLVRACQDRRSVELTLTTTLADQARLMKLAPRLAERLGGEVQAGTTYDGDVVLEVVEPKLAGLVGGRSQGGLSRLVAVGLASPRKAVYVEWPTAGHVLVAGMAEGGVETTLTSLVCALAARYRPEALQVYTVASHRTLPAPLFQMPHQVESVEPTNGAAVEVLLERLAAETLRRVSAASAGEAAEDEPQVVLLVHDLAELKESEALETVAVHGPAHGFQILGGTTQLEAVSDGTLALFPTRVALAMLDEAQSIRVLSDTVAADLGRGQLMVRLDGRWPLALQGFRVSPERLDELLRVMREAYGVVEAGEPAVGAEAGDEAELATADDVDALAVVLEEDIEADEEDLSDADEIGADLNGDVDPLEDEELSEEDIDTDLDVAPSQNGAPPGHSQDAGSPEPLVCIQCFGEFVVRRGATQLDPYVEGRYAHKSWELLAYLAAHPPQGVDVDRLMADLWPNLPPAGSRKPLNMATHRARLLLAGKGGRGGRGVRIDRKGLCHLDPNLVRSDVHQFLNLVANAGKGTRDEARTALEQAVALYRADLLSAPGTPTYPWVDERGDNGLTLRESYRVEYMAAVKRLARLYREDGDAQLAVPLLKGLLHQEPLLEDVVRDLYRCYEQLGDMGALLREDRRLRHALYTVYYDPRNPADDPGLYPPEAETVAVFEEVRRALEAASDRVSQRA